MAGSAADAEAAQLFGQGLEHISMQVIVSMVTPGLKVPSLHRDLRWNNVSRVNMDP